MYVVIKIYLFARRRPPLDNFRIFDRRRERERAPPNYTVSSHLLRAHNIIIIVRVYRFTRLAGSRTRIKNCTYSTGGRFADFYRDV